MHDTSAPAPREVPDAMWDAYALAIATAEGGDAGATAILRARQDDGSLVTFTQLVTSLWLLTARQAFGSKAERGPAGDVHLPVLRPAGRAEQVRA